MKPKSIEGLQIIGFYDNSQLAESGIEIGDWIIEYNGIKLENIAQFNKLKLKYQDYSNIVLKIRKKDGSEVFFQIWPGNLGVYLTEIEKSPKILPDAKRIEKIGRLVKKTGKENTFFVSLHKIFGNFNIDFDLNTLMGFAAFPFRLQFKSDISKNILDPNEGYDCAKFLFNNFQINFSKYSINNTTKTKIRNAIVKSINKGYPVLAKNFYNNEEWGIITGYQNRKKEFFCRSFSARTINYSLVPEFPEIVLVFNKKPDLSKAKKDKFRKQYKNSLLAAKMLLTKDSYNDYYLGNNALSKWRDLLEEEEYFKSLSKDEFDNVCKTHAMIIREFKYNMIKAADYLNNIEELFPESGKHLKRLAKFYKAQSKIISDSNRYIPSKGLRSNLRDIWDDQARKRQVVALTKIIKKNREILAVMEKLPLIRWKKISFNNQ